MNLHAPTIRRPATYQDVVDAPPGVVADLAGWRRERLPRLPETVGIETPPDWVCEVLSPSTRTCDLTEKRDIYAEHGAPHLWFVDPLARTLEAFALSDGRWSLVVALRDDAEVRIAPFDAAPFGLAALWTDPPASEGDG